MDKLLKIVTENDDVITRPVGIEEIEKLKKELGFGLSSEYEAYLKNFGIIIFESWETYGLGVKDDSYLNVLKIYQDLSSDEEYPNNTLPLMEIGDGSYYLYDNDSEMILLWSTPNGGVVRTLSETLEEFFLKYVFNQG